MKNKYNMTKEDNIFFAKRKLIDNLYKSANDDEIEALKIQMQLRDKINNGLKLEKMNE